MKNKKYHTVLKSWKTKNTTIPKSRKTKNNTVPKSWKTKKYHTVPKSRKTKIPHSSKIKQKNHKLITLTHKYMTKNFPGLVQALQ